MTDPELIVAAVLADATLTALIENRIYPVVLPTDAVPPAVTYMLVSQPTDGTQTDEQYRHPRWRFRVWSDRYTDLTPIAVGLASIFGYQARTPFDRSHIEYPSSATEGHDEKTHLYWRALDVVGFAAAGSVSQ